MAAVVVALAGGLYLLSDGGGGSDASVTSNGRYMIPSALRGERQPLPRSQNPFDATETFRAPARLQLGVGLKARSNELELRLDPRWVQSLELARATLWIGAMDFSRPRRAAGRRIAAGRDFTVMLRLDWPAGRCGRTPALLIEGVAVQSRAGDGDWKLLRDSDGKRVTLLDADERQGVVLLPQRGCKPSSQGVISA